MIVDKKSTFNSFSNIQNWTVELSTSVRTREGRPEWVWQECPTTWKHSYVSVTLCFNIHLELDVVACLRHWRKSQLFPGCANALAFVWYYLYYKIWSIPNWFPSSSCLFTYCCCVIQILSSLRLLSLQYCCYESRNEDVVFFRGYLLTCTVFELFKNFNTQLLNSSPWKCIPRAELKNGIMDQDLLLKVNQESDPHLSTQIHSSIWLGSVILCDFMLCVREVSIHF